MLINGKKVAEVVIKALRESEYDKLEDYLDSITRTYKPSNNIPEDIII